MSHAPATRFSISKRGFMREGYWADLVLVDPNSPWTVSPDNILYKCKWSPLTNQTLHSKICMTLVNGETAYENLEGDPAKAIIHNDIRGMRLEFER
jgi:dihydroorotase